jgi:Ca2+-binding EF-hand superfamily protein
MPVGSAAAAATGWRRGKEIAAGRGCRADLRITYLPPRKVVHGDEAEVLRERRARMAEISAKMLAMYDEDKSGELERRELASLLHDYGEHVMKRPQWPSEDDLDFIMCMCGDAENGKIPSADVMRAAHTWQDIIEQQVRVQVLLKKYDGDGSHDINEAELTRLMAELNDGLPVGQETISWVMAVGDKSGDGGLDFDELTRAVAAWYGHIEPASAGAKSSVCILL